MVANKITEKVVKSKEFKGDIVITDPCYIIKKDKNNDWSKCNCGFNCECLGIHNYMVNSTLYGDWSCTTYNKDTKEAIGEFCADSGLVSVFLLEKVRAYNSNIDNWIEEHPWCVTIIKDFDGIINFIHMHMEGVYDSTTKYWKKGDPCSDDILIVEGEGNMNFTTRQTSL